MLSIAFSTKRLLCPDVESVGARNRSGERRWDPYSDRLTPQQYYSSSLVSTHYVLELSTNLREVAQRFRLHINYAIPR